jgi:voltage-gated sodium channel
VIDTPRHEVVELCRKTVNSEWFHRAVLALILFNAAVMGLETWPGLRNGWAPTFHVANLVAQALFCGELAIRLAAHGRRPWDFFRNGWNVFDFTVVALSLLPAAGAVATLARLARVLRAGRLISGIPELRLIIGTMLRSIPSMGHVTLLLGLLMYVFGVIGCHLFAGVDPDHWGNLGRAAQTLFIIITLEGWVDIMQKSMTVSSWAWVYYLSFIVLGVFVVINLFIAVVINNLEKVREEESDAASKPEIDDAAAELRRLSARVEELTRTVAALNLRR